MTAATARTSRLLPTTALPLALILLACLVLPVAVFFVYGFWTSDLFGIHKTWTLEQYRTALSGFYLSVLLKTLATALAVAASVVVIAYSAGYVVTFPAERAQNLFRLLIVASALTSYLVRIYS